MILVKKITIISLLLFFAIAGHCQPIRTGSSEFSIITTDQQSQPVNGATVELRIGDRLIKASVSNKEGVAAFTIKDSGSYVFYISCTGYQSQTTEMMALPSALNSLKVMLHPGEQAVLKRK